MPFSGAKLRELREGAGLDRKQLAEAVGTTAQYVSHLENGVKTNPSFDLVEKVAAALGVDCRSFQEGAAEEPAPEAPPEPPARRRGKKK